MPKKQDEPYEWRCGTCGKWNLIEDALCRRCNMPSTNAVSYMVHQPLTKEEKEFHLYIVPHIVELLESILSELRRPK